MKTKKIIFATLIILVAIFAYSQSLEKKSLEKKQDANVIIKVAKNYLGTKYKRGGMDKHGMDCSGFVHIVYLESIQKPIPRTVKAMQKFATKIAPEQKVCGDLLFFADSKTKEIFHVGIYIGNNEFIHAASSGKNTGVIISNLDEGYWKNTFFQVGRVLNN